MQTQWQLNKAIDRAKKETVEDGGQSRKRRKSGKASFKTTDPLTTLLAYLSVISSIVRAVLNKVHQLRAALSVQDAESIAECATAVAGRVSGLGMRWGGASVVEDGAGEGRIGGEEEGVA
jgi:hypothetical protein